MLIIALVLAGIGLAALVFAVVTSNALVAWVCIGASLLGVLLLIVDALRERRRNGAGSADAPVAVAVDDSAESSETVEAVDPAVVEDYDAEAADATSEEPAAHPAD